MTNHRWGTGARDRTSTYQHQTQRKRILRRDQHRCQLHGPTCIGMATEMDHRIPVAFGGSDDDTNMQAVCRPCHQHKSSMEGVQARNADRARRRQRMTLPQPKHPGLL